MSPIILIIGIIILLLVLGFIFKKVLKVIVSILIIGLLATAVFGVFVYLDVQDFKENFPGSTNLVVIEQTEQSPLVFSVNLDNEDFNTIENPQHIVEILENKKYKQINELGYFKAFIIKESFLEKHAPEDLFVENTAALEAFGLSDADLETLQLLAATEYLLKEDPGLLFEAFKEGDIEIKKQTILIWLARQAPKDIIEFAL